MAFAAKLALRTRYGGGHFATVAAHCTRWRVGAEFFRGVGVRNATDIDVDRLKMFAEDVAMAVEDGVWEIAYGRWYGGITKSKSELKIFESWYSAPDIWFATWPP